MKSNLPFTTKKQVCKASLTWDFGKQIHVSLLNLNPYFIPDRCPAGFCSDFTCSSIIICAFFSSVIFIRFICCVGIFFLVCIGIGWYREAKYDKRLFRYMNDEER